MYLFRRKIRFIQKTVSLLFFLSFMISFHAFSQTAATIIKADSVKSGDVIDYILVVKRSDDSKVLLPDSSSFGEDFNIRSYKQFLPDAQTDSIIFKLQFFGVGDTQIPGFTVYLADAEGDTVGTVQTDLVPLFYKSLVNKDQEAVLKPLKKIFEFSALYWQYIVFVLLVLITALWAYSYWKKRKANTAEEETFVPAIFVDPIRELDRMLDEIKQGEALKTGELKGFYTDLGDAIRLYIKRVYKENALEMTTSELKYALQKKRFDAQFTNMILLILSQADRVKFATYKPSMDSVYDDLERAFDLAKKFRATDKALLAQFRYDFEIEHGLRKPEVEESEKDKAENETTETGEDKA